MTDTVSSSPHAESGIPEYIRLPFRSAWHLVRLGYALLALVAILAISYLLGHTQLEGYLSGNDIPWALSMAQWYARWFPDMPIWFPLQGAGTPLLFLYQPGSSFLVVLITSFTNLSVVQAFRLLAFLSIPIGGIGLYLVVWNKTRSQTVALIAGLIYPLSTGTWDWLVRVGLYAQTVAIMFVPWTFLLFDQLLSTTDSNDPKIKSGRLWPRLAFIFAAVLYALLFVTHIPTALVFLMAATAYAAGLAYFRPQTRALWRSLIRNVLKAWGAVAMGLALVGLWLVPFVKLNGHANREGLSYIPAEQVSTFDFATTLGFSPPDPAYGMTFSPVLVGLGIVGIAAGFWRREAPAMWGMMAIGSVLFVAMPVLWIEFVRLFAPLWAATNDRAVLLAMIFVPAAAAYGAYAIGRLVAHLPAKLLERLTSSLHAGEIGDGAVRVFRIAAVAAISLAVALFLVLSGPTWFPDLDAYGPKTANMTLQEVISDTSLARLDPAQFSLSSEGDLTNRSDILAFSEELEFDANTRLDVSPNLGGITQALSLYSDASIINIYGFNASLIHEMWGYQSKVFYTEPLEQPDELNNLADWFGLKYVVLHSKQDPMERYDTPGWSVAYPEISDDTNIVEVHQYSNAPSMVSLSSRPLVLVIGGYENSIYQQAFSTFSKGAFPYQDGLVIEGKHSIDDYSIDELNVFDVLFLHGYGYKDQEKAWGLLQEYVDQGGSLFVDTGWQFFTPDWEMTDTPAVMPVQDLAWIDLGVTSNYQLDNRIVGSTVSASSLSPLAWEDVGWSVSSPSRGLRKWAQPVLTAEGQTLIAAGEFGNGRVVWSGMNLVGHIMTYDNQSERQLLRNLMNWLVAGSQGAEHMAPKVDRPNPDLVQFTFDNPLPSGSSLIWREAYSPGWRATLRTSGSSSDLQIYRAGPGMMLIMLPEIREPGAVIELNYGLGWIGPFGWAVSFLAAGVLASYLFAPSLLTSVGQRLKDYLGRKLWSRDDDQVPYGKASKVQSPQAVGRPSQDGALEAQPQEAASSAGFNLEVAPEFPDQEQLAELWRNFQRQGELGTEQDGSAEKMIASWREKREGK